MPCQHVFTKGPRAGSNCPVKPKYGGDYCGRHRRQHSSVREENIPPQDINEPTTTCQHTFVKGVRMGLTCGVKPKNGGSFCARHTKRPNRRATQVVVIEEPENDCSICLETVKDDDVMITVCKNGHNLHRTCGLQWSSYHHRCPVCRVRMFTNLTT